MKVICIGSGYVGTVTAISFAATGHTTTLVDLNEQKVKLIKSKHAPIYEHGLDQMLQLPSLPLDASTSYASVRAADVVMICVGTPPKKDGNADLHFVRMAVEEIAKHLDPLRFTVIAIKSTVPVGTARWVGTLLEPAVPPDCFAVVSNPEFLREGFALEDVFFPDRIVLGSNHAIAKQTMKQLYQGITNRQRYDKLTGLVPTEKWNVPKPVVFETDPHSAELLKYASNAFLAVKISYINEMAMLCEALGADIIDVAKGMGLDPRIGERFLQPSPGWGGSCLPKDTAQVLETSRQYGRELSIVKAAMDANQTMLQHCLQKLIVKLNALNGKRIGILGLTFKPGTDDIRATQAVPFIRRLLELGASVSVHDPLGMASFKRQYPGLAVDYSDHPEQTAHRADAVVLFTHWEQYAQLDWPTMVQTMRVPYILDTRNFLDRRELTALGYDYDGIGRRKG